MELIVISHTKIKIMLTKPDMEYYKLASADSDSADDSTRRAVRRILSDADRQVGFDTEGERLFVQFFASLDGGCEIFVTKLGKNSDITQETNASEERLLACVREYEPIDAHDETEDRMPLPRSNLHPPLSYTDLQRISHTADPLTIVRVNELSDLLALCHRLLNTEFDGKSAVYIHEAQRDFYLCLREFENAAPFLAEYGDVSRNATLVPYIDEHAKLLCEENAVQLLGVL